MTTRPKQNGSKLVGSEAVPLITGAAVAEFLSDIYQLGIDHAGWWPLSGRMFAFAGAITFFIMRKLNTWAMHESDYRDEIEQARIAQAWAAVPIPVQLLIEWAQRPDRASKLGAPSGAPTPPASTPVLHGPYEGTKIQISRSTPSNTVVQTQSPAPAPAPPPPTLDTTVSQPDLQP
jgi:hypothetical protein